MRIVKALFAGLVCLFLGAIPFLVADRMASRDGGAPFIFFGWIVLGVPVCFVVLPLAFVLTNRLPGVLRYVTYPAIVSLGMVVLSVATVPRSFEFTSGDLGLFVIFLVTIWGSWWIYVKICGS